MKLLIFEGIDGAGKTTIAKKLYEYLLSQDIPTTFYKEPHHDIPPNSSPFTQMLFFTASRSWLFENHIKPDLQQGKVVILDRSFISTLAYQCLFGGVDLTLTLELNKKILNGIRFYVFYLDLPPEIAHQRKPELDLKTLEKLRNAYLQLLKGKAYIINASNELDKVFSEVKLIADEIVRATL